MNNLTPREREVLKLVAAGLSSKEIAAALGISFKTVVCHRARVLEKLDVHRTADLTRYAIAERILPDNLSEQDRLRQELRTAHKNYQSALTRYNGFLEERKSMGLANPDSSERTRQLGAEEQRSHQQYIAKLKDWADFVLGPARFTKAPGGPRESASEIDGTNGTDTEHE